jgi:hypothetical protein
MEEAARFSSDKFVSKVPFKFRPHNKLKANPSPVRLTSLSEIERVNTVIGRESKLDNGCFDLPNTIRADLFRSDQKSRWLT